MRGAKNGAKTTEKQRKNVGKTTENKHRANHNAQEKKQQAKNYLAFCPQLCYT